MIHNIELINAFIVGWMTRPVWDYFLKPVFSSALKAYYSKEKNT